MKKLAPTIVLLLALVPGSLLAQQLTDKEREHLVSYLQDTQKKLMKETEGLTAEQWAFKPAPEVWSVAEVLEHITVSEKGVMEMMNGILQTPLTAEQKAEVPAKTEMIVPLMRDRSQKFQAPEVVQPTKQLGEGSEVGKAFSSTRGSMLEFVKSSGADFHGNGMEHPAFGALDGYQWLLFIAAHAERHLMQIQEVKANPEFPKKST